VPGVDTASPCRHSQRRVRKAFPPLHPREAGWFNPGMDLTTPWRHAGWQAPAAPRRGRCRGVVCVSRRRRQPSRRPPAALRAAVARGCRSSPSRSAGASATPFATPGQQHVPARRDDPNPSPLLEGGQGRALPALREDRDGRGRRPVRVRAQGRSAAAGARPAGAQAYPPRSPEPPPPVRPRPRSALTTPGQAGSRSGRPCHRPYATGPSTVQPGTLRATRELRHDATWASTLVEMPALARCRVEGVKRTRVTVVALGRRGDRLCGAHAYKWRLRRSK